MVNILEKLWTEEGSVQILLLLAGDRLGLALAGAGVGVSALTADRQALAVTQTTIAREVHEALDVHRHFAAKIAFHGVLGVDRFADLKDLCVRKVGHAAGVFNTQLVGDLLGLVCANAMDVGQRDDHALVGGDVDPCNTSHLLLRLLHRPRESLAPPISSRKLTREIPDFRMVSGS